MGINVPGPTFKNKLTASETPRPGTNLLDNSTVWTFSSVIDIRHHSFVISILYLIGNMRWAEWSLATGGNPGDHGSIPGDAPFILEFLNLHVLNGPA